MAREQSKEAVYVRERIQIEHDGEVQYRCLPRVFAKYSSVKGLLWQGLTHSSGKESSHHLSSPWVWHSNRLLSWTAYVTEVERLRQRQKEVQPDPR